MEGVYNTNLSKDEVIKKLKNLGISQVDAWW
jgi:hypothetical protein